MKNVSINCTNRTHSDCDAKKSGINKTAAIAPAITKAESAAIHNRLKSLEQNVSLSSSYLDDFSKLVSTETEAHRKQINESITKLNDTLNEIEELEKRFEELNKTLYEFIDLIQPFLEYGSLFELSIYIMILIVVVNAIVSASVKAYFFYNIDRNMERLDFLSYTYEHILRCVTAVTRAGRGVNFANLRLMMANNPPPRRFRRAWDAYIAENFNPDDEE